MKVIIAFLLALLIVGAQAQQAVTLPDCLAAVGQVLSDVALVYGDKSRSNIQKARGDVQMAYGKCRAAIPNQVSTPSCDDLLSNIKTVKKADLKALHLKYQSCVVSRA